MATEMSKEDRKRLMPETSAIVESYWKAFGGLDSVVMREAGHKFKWEGK